MRRSQILHRALAAILTFTAAFGVAGVASAQDGPTFEQVLAAPDDLALNLRFAEAEARDGNLLSASAALERILLQAPGWSQARLLYAAVLYRLDDMAGAAQQLSQVDASKLSAVQKAEAARYERLITSRRSRFTFSGELALGVAYQGDAVGASNLQYDFPGFVMRDNGAAGVVDARLNGAFKLRPAGDVQAFGTIGLFRTEDLSNLDTDYQRADVAAGIVVTNRMSSFRLAAVGRDHDVRTEHYLSEAGGRIEATLRPNTATSFSGSAEYVRQQYTEPFIDTVFALGGKGHDGTLLDVTAGISHRLSASQTLGVRIGLAVKDAEYDGFSYQAERIEAGYDQTFRKGVYASLRGQFGHYEYDEPDVLLSGATREDDRYRLRAALGAPLSAFSGPGATGDARQAMILEGAVTYDHRASNAPLAGYSSLGGELRLVFRFGARP